MPLYLIDYNDDASQDCLDQIVEADTPRDAMKIWFGWVCKESYDASEIFTNDVWVWTIPTAKGKPSLRMWEMADRSWIEEAPERVEDL